MASISNVAPLAVPERLMLPAPASLAAAIASAPPSATLMAPEFMSVPKSTALVTTLMLPPAELIAVPPLKIVTSMAVAPAQDTACRRRDLRAKVGAVGIDDLAAAAEDGRWIGGSAEATTKRRPSTR